MSQNPEVLARWLISYKALAIELFYLCCELASMQSPSIKKLL